MAHLRPVVRLGPHGSVPQYEKKYKFHCSRCNPRWKGHLPPRSFLESARGISLDGPRTSHTMSRSFLVEMHPCFLLDRAFLALPHCSFCSQLGYAEEGSAEPTSRLPLP